jgi:hypothetical protein
LRLMGLLRFEMGQSGRKKHVETRLSVLKFYEIPMKYV